jgi:hypothetical protein
METTELGTALPASPFLKRVRRLANIADAWRLNRLNQIVFQDNVLRTTTVYTPAWNERFLTSPNGTSKLALKWWTKSLLQRADPWADPKPYVPITIEKEVEDTVYTPTTTAELKFL